MLRDISCFDTYRYRYFHAEGYFMFLHYSNSRMFLYVAKMLSSRTQCFFGNYTLKKFRIVFLHVSNACFLTFPYVANIMRDI